MIQNLIFVILFLKILFPAYNVGPHVPVDIIRVFFYSRCSSRKSQRQSKLATKIIHFTIQFRSKNLTHFTNLSSFDIENNMPLKHSQKPFSLFNFSSKHASVWCQKKIFNCTISWRWRLHSRINLKANVCIFLNNSLKNICFKDVVRFYLVGCWVSRGWIIPSRQLAVWIS